MQAATAGTAAQVQFFDGKMLPWHRSAETLKTLNVSRLICYMVFADQFEGGSQMFPVTVPATGCSTCAELVGVNCLVVVHWQQSPCLVAWCYACHMPHPCTCGML